MLTTEEFSRECTETRQGGRHSFCHSTLTAIHQKAKDHPGSCQPLYFLLFLKHATLTPSLGLLYSLFSPKTLPDRWITHLKALWSIFPREETLTTMEKFELCPDVSPFLLKFLLFIISTTKSSALFDVENVSPKQNKTWTVKSQNITVEFRSPFEMYKK